MEGRLQVFFYDTEAGVTEVNAKYARPRTIGSSPYILEVGDVHRCYESAILMPYLVYATIVRLSTDLWQACLSNWYDFFSVVKVA